MKPNPRPIDWSTPRNRLLQASDRRDHYRRLADASLANADLYHFLFNLSAMVKQAEVMSQIEEQEA